MSRPEALAARDSWAEAVWSSQLPGLQRLVALAYADHAGNGLAEVWVVGSRLLERTGISRDAAYRALRGLQEAGWMTMTSPAAQHRSARYTLIYPSTTQVSVSRTPQVSVSRTAEGTSGLSPVLLNSTSCTSPAASCTSPDASSTGDRPDLSSYLSPQPARATSSEADPGAGTQSATEEEVDQLAVVEVAALPDAASETSTLPLSELPARQTRTGSSTDRPAVAQSPADKGERSTPTLSRTATAPTVDPRRADVERAARTAGARDDVLQEIVDLALTDKQTHSPAGRLLRDPGYLERLERTVRARRAEQRGAVVREITHHDSPQCEHGTPGGEHLHPTSHLPICALCRNAITRGMRPLAVAQ